MSSENKDAARTASILSSESQVTRFDRWVEFIAAVVLSLATVATAWAGYQATLWGGDQSAFMAQAGTLVVLGDAGDALGDSIYEARLYVRGAVKSLGADCIEKPMREEHIQQVQALLDKAGFKADPKSFKRYGSARKLYNFHVDNAGAY